MMMRTIIRGAGAMAFLCLSCLPLDVSAQRGDFRSSGNPPQVWVPLSTGQSAPSSFGLGWPSSLAVKTNLLYGATLTPNLGIEFGLNRRMTLEISAGFNPWVPAAADASQASETSRQANKLKHWLVKPEFRYWLDDRFSGHFVGLQAFYADFDIHGYEVPTLLKKDPYNDGTAFGGGLVYGYHWAFAKRWGLEFHAAGGLIQADYLEKTCDTCSGSSVSTRYKKTFFGPIGAGIKLVFLIK